MPAAPTTRPDPPTESELADMLGPAAESWTTLQSSVRAGRDRVTERWVYGGRKYGWSCRLERGKTGILYMMPADGHFRVGLALSDAAREAALASDLPDELRTALSSAVRAIEGWPVRLAVHSAVDVAVVVSLVKLKMPNAGRHA
jgi:hypothetical protein